jgi:hypothetical protein
VQLTDELLDKIDEIVPPATNANPFEDSGFDKSNLETFKRRR